MKTNFTLNGTSGLFSAFPPAFAGVLLLVLAVVQLIVVIILAFAVKNDAQRKQQSPAGLFLISPWMWFFVVVFTGGYIGAFAYWIIHYSAQRHRGATNG